MAAIDDVLSWASTLPAWQGDAVRRLLVAGEQPLSTQDYSEVLTLAKAHLQLEPMPDNIKPLLPAKGMFSGVPATSVAIKLMSVDDVRNVNIIKSGQAQPFSENGITVVYGDNGSGKSGYARILKLACQARDKEDRILSDVFATVPAGTPTATLKIKHDGTIRDIAWSQDTTTDPILTNIAVFDDRCARVITDHRNEISFLPYGCDVFQKLVEIVRQVKADLEAEIRVLTPLRDSAVPEGTPSAIFLESLSADTKEEVIHASIAWSSQDQLDLTNKEELARKSDTANATKEVDRLTKIKGRVDIAISAIARLNSRYVDLTNEAINSVLTQLEAAQLAHATAVAERQVPEPLVGVATTSQWEILYNAAKDYSEQVAYPGQPFPATTEAVCVLCQQSLGEDAVARFARFKRFMEDATSTALAAKREALISLRQKFADLIPLVGPALESMCDELATFDSIAANALRDYHTAVTSRKAATIALLDQGKSLENIATLGVWPVSAEAPLQTVSTMLIQKCAEITAASKPGEFQKLITDVAQLKARKAIGGRKSDIEAFVKQARRNSDLSHATNTLRTQEITRQGTTIVGKNLTPALLQSFKAELEALGATRVPISVKPSGADGETAHELLLEGANQLGKIRMSKVLSEGEARVIAIAGFLAELQLAPHGNTIVFDDPVSSLDHIFTAKIAARLAKEALSRQVIVFTHNIGFLMELHDAATALAKTGTPVAIAVHSLRRAAKAAGITTDGAPWYALKVNQRAHYMQQIVHRIKSLYQDDMAQYNEQAARVYGLLREAWESCIEDDLFYSVVCRYRNSVQTLKLIEVEIEDPDFHHVDLHVSKASTWMTGHDKSKALHDDRPAPNELLADIEALRDFSKKVVDRRKETEKRRKAQLKA